MTEWDNLVDLIKTRGTMRREKPVRLSSGAETWVYLDIKGVLHDAWGMKIAADALFAWLVKHDLFSRATAIGGPTMGADVLSHGLLMGLLTTNMKWFSVRDKAKTTHGLGRWIEGATLGPEDNVIITDDVASSGKSLVEACQRVLGTGASIAAVVPLVDRAGLTEDRLKREVGISAFKHYLPVINYTDLDLPPITG